MTKGNLIDHIHRNNSNYSQLFKFALDIAQGMEFLIDNGVIHRNLAARNCYLDYFNNVLVGDFGFKYIETNCRKKTKHLLKLGERRGFPRMFGSVDCMHWQWERCPNAWKDQFTRGD